MFDMYVVFIVFFFFIWLLAFGLWLLAFPCFRRSRIKSAMTLWGKGLPTASSQWPVAYFNLFFSAFSCPATLASIRVFSMSRMKPPMRLGSILASICASASKVCLMKALILS